MSLVNVINVVVLDNPTYFTNPFQFEITFECLQDLQDDLEWKVLYVGSAESSEYDQVLDEVMVGPVHSGVHKFVLHVDAPDVTRIPPAHILGVTVCLITCCYQQHEFVRIGYYVNNELSILGSGGSGGGGDEIDGMEDDGHPDPTFVQSHLSQVTRTILADKPRVTRFSIPWDGNNAVTAVGDMDTRTPTKEMLLFQQNTSSLLMEENTNSNIVSPSEAARTVADMEY